MVSVPYLLTAGEEVLWTLVWLVWIRTGPVCPEPNAF